MSCGKCRTLYHQKHGHGKNKDILNHNLATKLLYPIFLYFSSNYNFVSCANSIHCLCLIFNHITMLATHYINLVQFQNIAHDYHIRTLNTDYVIHGYLGSLYETLVGNIDTVGEQMIITSEPVPGVKDCFSALKGGTADNAQSMIKELFDAFKQEEKNLIELAKQDMDEGTRNIVADEICFFGKEAAKLKSLIRG